MIPYRPPRARLDSGEPEFVGKGQRPVPGTPVVGWLVAGVALLCLALLSSFAVRG